MSDPPLNASPTSGQVWAVAADCFTRWQDGDTEALDDLVATMTPVLWHVVRSYRLEQELAEDVIQTTWLAFVRRSGSINDPVAVGSWLTTTARRESWRVVSRSRRDIPTDDETLTFQAPAQRSAEQSAVEGDEARRLWQAVHTLDDRCQKLLRIVAFDERPDYQRIAGELDMPIGSIGPTRGRCLDKLRGALASPVAPDERNPNVGGLQ